MSNYTFAFAVISQQQNLLRLVQQYNLEENIWHSLKERRQKRRKLLRLSNRQHHALDIAEYENAKPPQDCIAS